MKTAAVLLTLVLAGSAVAANPPNILLIVADDLGWTDTSVQIDPTVPQSKSDFYQTPNLEALAAAGMRFTNAYSSSPVCTATRAAIQTGKTPAALHMTDITDGGILGSERRELDYDGKPLIPPMQVTKLPLAEITIAEQLKAGNPAYRTGFFQKWDLVSADEALPQLGDVIQQGYDVAKVGTAVFPEAQDPYKSRGANVRALQFIQDSVNQNRPWFAQLSYLQMHAPYRAMQSTIDKYNALPKGARHDDPLYAAVMEEFDTIVGELFSSLNAMGVTDNTYIIFCSDNGGKVGGIGTENDPLFNGKGSVWEGGLRVPMFVKGPGIASGSISNVPVVSHDLFSTIMDMAGIATPDPVGVEGTSFMPVLTNGGALPGGIPLSRAYGPNGEIFFHYPHYDGTAEGVYRRPASAIRDGNYKLVRVYGENGAPDQVFLFNLAANLTESNNVDSPLNIANLMPDRTASMLAKLDNWLEGVDADMPEPPGGDFNGDGAVDSQDLVSWSANYGKYGSSHSQGDANGNAITDGSDFLAWQLKAGNADFDRNGAVNGVDLGRWETSYGVNGGGDTDGNGKTDGRDFLAWQRQRQGFPLLNAAATTVPEPASWILVLMVSSAALARRKGMSITTNSHLDAAHR